MKDKPPVKVERESAVIVLQKFLDEKGIALSNDPLSNIKNVSKDGVVVEYIIGKPIIIAKYK